MRRRRAASAADEQPEPDLPWGRPMLGNGLHLPVTPAMVPEILEQARCLDLPDNEGVFRVDWAGVRTRIPMLPWAPARYAGTTSTRVPVPSDGYRSEAEEYVSLILSLTSSTDTYRVVEAGAGWAPWAVMGIVCAKRLGKQAHGIAVEADATRAGWAMRHAEDNNLTAELLTGSPAELAAALASASTADLRVVQAAVWTESTTLRFPTLDAQDMGGAVNTEVDPNMDYRGANLPHVDVPTVTLAGLLAGPAPTDLLHVDVQGMECEVLLPERKLIAQRVRFMTVGTHDRHVEGRLQDAYLREEWALLLESPCRAVFDGVKPTLTGFTTQDGNQVWANSRFRDANPLILRT